MTSSIRLTRRGRGVVALAGIVVLAILAALFVRSCNNDGDNKPKTEKATNKPIGGKGLKPKDVTVSGSHVPTDIKAVKTKPFTGLQMVNSLTAPMEITPHGKLQGQVTLRFQLNRALEKGEKVHVVTRDTPTGELRFVDATVTGRYATVTTSHFSVWQAISVKWREAGEYFRNDFAEFISGGYFQKVDPPKCDKQGETKARTENYTIESSSSNTVFWCFEKLGNGKRVLQVTNNKHYALQVNYRNARVFDMGLAQAELPELVRLVKGKNWQILLPGQTMQLYVDPLEFGGTASINTSVSGEAQAIYKLQAALTVAMMLGGKIGGKKTKNLLSLQKQVEEAMDDVLAVKKCYNAVVSNNLSSVLYECVRIEKWLKLHIGAPGNFVGDTIAMIQTAGGLAKWFRQEIEIMTQYSKSAYYITIKRGEVLQFHNLTIPLQPGWKVGEVAGPYGVGVVDGRPCTEAYLVDCPGFMLFDRNSGQQGAAPTYDYGPDYPWKPGNDQKGCPIDREKYPFAYEGKNPSDTEATPKHRTTAHIGGRTVTYTEWTIGCAEQTGQASFSTSYVQKVWYDPISKIFVVDEWDTAGLKEALAKARWN